MSTPKREIEYMNSTETKMALLEQSLIHISGALSEIKNDLKGIKGDLHGKFANLEKEIQDENGKVWKKLEHLDQRINDNFRYVIGIMITLFSGLYATALGGMLLRLCHWI